MGENGTAMEAGAGTEVDDTVGGPHGFGIVFDNEEGVALGLEDGEGLEEAIIVTGMEPDGRLIENVEDAGEIGAELGGEANTLGFAAGEGVGGAVEGQVAEADLVHELETLFDFGKEILEDGLAPAVEVELLEGIEQLNWRQGQKVGKVDGFGFSEEEKNGARNRVETSALAGRTLGGVMKLRWQVGEGFIVAHPIIEYPVTPARRTPAASGIPGKVFRIERREGFAGGGIGIGGGKPSEMVTDGIGEEAGTLAELHGQIDEGGGGDGKAAGGQGDFSRIGLMDTGSNDEFDIVFIVAIEFFKSGKRDNGTIDAEVGIALSDGPVGNGLVVSFTTADERGAEIEEGLAAFFELVEVGFKMVDEGGFGEGDEGLVIGGIVLNADTGEEEAEVLGDLGNGGDG